MKKCIYIISSLLCLMAGAAIVYFLQQRKVNMLGQERTQLSNALAMKTTLAETLEERIGDMLNRRFSKALNGAKVLVLGVAYKQDIDDYRESPAIRVIEELKKEGADVRFYDPCIRRYRHKGAWYDGEEKFTAELLESSDIVVITTAHTTVDYDFVQQHARAVFDTKNAMKAVSRRDNIEVL